MLECAVQSVCCDVRVGCTCILLLLPHYYYYHTTTTTILLLLPCCKGSSRIQVLPLQPIETPLKLTQLS